MRRAVRVRLRDGPGDLDVLEAERRARADQDRRVRRQLGLGRLELQVQHRARSRRRAATNALDAADDADARAADPDLVALDQPGRVRDLGRRARSVGTNGSPLFAL